jgi:fatty-acyl-CoA synthase
VLFAAARLGALVVPISPRYKAPEAKHLLTVSRARLALAPRRFLDTPYAELAEGLRADLPYLEAVWAIDDPGALLPVPAAEAPAHADGSELLCCFSTSGTTGSPKLAAHNQASIVRHARHVARGMDIRPGDAVLCALPLFGVFGFMGALATLAGGGTCVIQQHFEPEPAARAFGPHRITHMLGSDSMFEPMMRVAGADFSTWRHAAFADFVGLGEEVTRRADELGVRFSATYGSSECYSLMSFHDWNAGPEVRARAGGVPVDPAIEVRIVDPEAGTVLPDGERGEIQVRGPNVLDEYLNNPEATAKAKTADGWFRTGDLGYREGDTYVYLARMGDSLRLRGFLVNPAEIENCLIQVKGVGGAQVVGVSRPGEGDAAVAYVIAAPDAPLPDEAALLAHCRANIASYKVPLRVVALEAFPTLNGPNGFKVQKRTLREMARELLGLPPLKKT